MKDLISGTKILVILMTMVVSLVSLQSCKSKMLLPSETKKPFITIGNGGGFTGAVSTFYLMDDGALYRSGFDDTSYVFIGNIDHNLSDQLFSNYKSLHLDKASLDEPGNRYYFLSMNQKGKEQKLIWGRNQLENKNIEIYHRTLMSIIKKKSDDEENKPMD